MRAVGRTTKTTTTRATLLADRVFSIYQGRPYNGLARQRRREAASVARASSTASWHGVNKSAPDLGRRFLQFCSRRQVRVAGWKNEAKAISDESRDHVKMHVE